MDTTTFTESLVIEHCHVCDSAFGMTRGKQRRCREDGETFYCPNGHSAVYCNTEVQKLQGRLDAQAAKLAWGDQRIASLREQNEATERSLLDARRVSTRLKKRTVINGVCPCCNRSFENVKRHMKTKHPEYVETA